MDTTFPTCTACQGPLDVGGMGSRYQVCFGCVKARHRAATTGGRCKCPKSMKRPIVSTRKIGRRTETRTGCDRCLGVISTWT